MNWTVRSLTLGLLAAAASALLPAQAGAAVTLKTFATPGQHAFVVPPAVSSLNVTLVGGDGGAGRDGTAGGAPATVTATLAVHPGQVLYVETGGNGQAVNGPVGGAGGYNGGGTGGDELVLFAGAPSGGGGGGASDIRTIPVCVVSDPGCGSLASRLVVAAGGGGGGGSSTNESGGTGGASDADGSAGLQDYLGDVAGTGGLRGTLLSGGAAGSPGAGSPSDPGASTPGTLGLGGEGASGLGGSGGGGGGGIFGGGGGGVGDGQIVSGSELVSAGGGGGGGGSSSQPPGPKGVTNLTLRPTASGAQPRVTLAWKLPAPSVRTLRATSIAATSATLHGTVNPNAAQLATCRFTISPASLVGSVLPCAEQVHAGTAAVPVSARVGGLKPGTRYTVRLTASNAQGVSRGAPVSFTTRPRR